MKKIFSLILCVVLLIYMITPRQALAAETSSQEVDLGNGISYVETLTVGNTNRAKGISWTKGQEYHYKNQVIAVIEITASFIYNGSTVSVYSKKVSQKATYHGWTFTQTSFTSSGGTVRLKGKLKKFGIETVYVNLAMTCDKNGHIS